MIKRILKSKLPLIVYHPLKVYSLDYFREIHNSGGLPVLDTEFFDLEISTKIIEELQNESILFGIRIFVNNKKLIDFINQNYFFNLDVIIFSYYKKDHLSDFIFNNKEYKIFIETTHIKINDQIDTICPHGLIVKGYEAPGKISKYTSFVLMQWYLKNTSYPVFVHGGVGMYTAPGMFAAGVNGVVLDNQLYLSKEAPLSENYKDLIAKLDESDSTVIGQALETPYRFFSKLGTKITKEFKEKESHLAEQDDAGNFLYSEIRKSISALDNKDDNPMQSLFYLGQDAFFAKNFNKMVNKKKKIVPLKNIINTFFEYISILLNEIDIYDPLKANSPLAKEHGTKYPVVQGPMGNISDNTTFAATIYENGALPFFALGNLPPELTDKILTEGNEKVKTYGAGLIGVETINQSIHFHIEQVKKHKSPFALFAGGVPSQVNELESLGIKTYLHTPSVSMLDNAIESGCKRFIFEGTEAGGHIGSQTSLVLWETSINKIVSENDNKINELRLLFAGGISTRFASFFISGMTSFLAKKGAKIGIQVGTIYLFTEEILATGAINKLYQDVISKADETIVAGRTVGLTSRTVRTPFTEKLIREEHQRVKDGIPFSERKHLFEIENIGSLLIAAKAFAPKFTKTEDGETKVTFVPHNGKEQYKKGNFMIGDSLAFESSSLMIPEIHKRYFDEKKELFDHLNAVEIFSNTENLVNDEIAIIGMGCIYPDANNTDAFWQNIVSKKYSIKEAPKDRFDFELYFDEDRKAEDKSYSKIAGVIDDFEFHAERFGYTEEKAAKLSRSQKMVLEAAYQAVEDAGYLDDNNRLKKEFRKKTAVIIGSCLTNELSNNCHLKYYYPEMKYYLDQIEGFKNLSEKQKENLLENLKERVSAGVKYEPVHGSIINIEASRIAYHLGIEGINFTVDAACATSFTTIDCGINELLSGNHDLSIVGGINSNLAPEPFIGFSKMGALSNDGSFPFDERANGFVLGEGTGVLILKRIKDAIRDNNKIYGVIKAVGSSSDGKGKAIAAPSSLGQIFALKRCFEKIKTDVSYSDIDYIEAHGTATIMGDQAEIETLKNVYKSDSPIGVSSIKSQIGHLLGGAGCAGLIKALLAIKNKTLPPNGKFEKISSNFSLKNTPFYIIKDPTEWKVKDGKSRKAAVSSYGFGGINYHCVIEEYTKNYKIFQRKIFPDLEYDFNDDRIVVAGLGIMAPGAKNVDEFWKNLVECNDVISEIPESRFHNKYYEMEDDESDFKLPLVKAGIIKDYKFNNSKFRVPPFTAKSIDRAQQFCIEAADQAIEQSKLLPILQKKGNKTAVILGTIPGEFHVENILRNRIPFLKQVINETENIDKEILEKVSDQFVDALKDRYLENTEDTIPGLLSNIISGRIANYFNCNAANFVVDASCASSAIAIRAGVNGLLSKDYDFVLTGGADANLYPTVLVAFKRLGLLSDNECSFFDTNSRGYIMSEGSAIQVLTTYKNAVKNNMTIIGEIDAVHFSSSVPNHLLSPLEQAFTQTIDECFKKSSVNKNQISHLDVFGFANYFLDLVEKQAIEASFDSEIFFGNVKHQFGYFKGANPAIVLTKLMLMLKNRAILPNFCYKSETSIIDEKSILVANTELFDVSKRHSLYMASNVNGIGGNHGHMIVGRIPEYLEKKKQVKSDISVIPKRKSFPEIMKKNYDNESKDEYNIPETLIQEKGKQKIIVLLSGQGAQHSGMMKELYDIHKVIKRLMDQGNEIFINERGYSLLDMMFGKDDSLNLTENTQPAIFISTAAIYKFLSEKGFKPDCFIGHSVGEYSALYCCGVLSFENAMKLIIKRSDFMKQAAENIPGRIMVVFKNAKDTLSLIRESEIPDIYVANKNSQRQTAVSGRKQEIEKFCEYLTENGQMFSILKLSGAFHTPLFKTAAESLNEYINSIYLNDVDYSRIISNVNGKPYPKDMQSIKELLVRQITSPVEFIKSIENVYESGRTHFIEIGPSRILSNFLKYINIVNYHSLPSVDMKKGQSNTLDLLCDHLEKYNKIFAYKTPVIPKPVVLKKPNTPDRTFENNKNFEKFKERNTELMNDIMYQEFLKHEKYAAYDKFDFYTGKVNISGVSIGLPGKGKRVFASDNFDKLIEGTNFIESLPQLEKEKIADKNVTRLFKQPDGNAKFVEITSPEDVVQLAGQLGYFDIHDEYGIKAKYDYSMELAMAAGIEALKDANIPLVMRYKETSSGSKIPDGFALPAEMQNNTGVIITSLFPSNETLIEELTRYYYNKFYIKPYEELENIYYHIMQSSVAKEIKNQVTDWFFKIKERRKEFSTFKFDRNYIANVCPLGAAHLAQLIKAKGPNVLVSGACASTTQAVGIAEDWIRSRRCDRVIIIGGENATSPLQNQWVGTSFMAIGAASVKKYVEEAAKPFDEDRNGTILGAGAVSLVVEREDIIRERGMNGQAQILGVYLGNSAYHPYNIEVNHLASELGKFIEKTEYLHDLDKNEYVPKLVFMSHETFTPARGGSADAEIKALRVTFPDHYKDIVISNTKGYTGHTLGAGIEDAVLIKAMQKGTVPPIPNLKKIPENFRDLNLNKNHHGDYQYGLHLAAGFGSHFAFILLKRVEENKIKGNEAYKAWLTRVSGDPDPKVSIIDNILCIEPSSNVINENKPVRKPAPEVAVEKKSPVSSSIPKSLENFSGTIKKIIAEQTTGYTVDMLENDLDLEADFGIDTIKQVKIFGKIASNYNIKVPEDLKLNELNTINKLIGYIKDKVGIAEEPVSLMQPISTSQEIQVDASDILETSKQIIADQTGYTTDMLEDDLDLEADLGIDTVKQVEIFGKISAHYKLKVPEDLKLQELNTIIKLVEYIKVRTGAVDSVTTPTPTEIVESTVIPSSDVFESVQNIIADQTGYTTDMLEDDLDLEADLGIDTVKQVEIFGKISDSYKLKVPEDLKLNELNTIGKLVEYISNSVSGEKKKKTEQKNDVSAPIQKIGSEEKPIKRLIVRVKETNLPEISKSDFNYKTILITKDNFGFSDKIYELIKVKNGNVITIGEDDKADIKLDLADIKAVEENVAKIKKDYPNLNGLIHLAPLNFYFDRKEIDDKELNTSIKSLFLMIKGLYDILDKPGSFIATLSFDSVIFPYFKNSKSKIFPTFAGISGMLKTVNKEMANTRVKIVDFSVKKSLKYIEDISNTFLNELLSEDKSTETGYRDNKKYHLVLKNKKIEKGDSIVTEEDIILITGGAGGITFELLKQVARTYKVKFVIFDINDISQIDEKFLTKEADNAFILNELKNTMKGSKPLEIKAAVDTTLRVKQTIDNLNHLRSFGVEVEYNCVDVTKYDIVEKIIKKYDKIDGILHAAGLEQSQFIAKKEFSSFNIVIDVKVKGILNILKAIRKIDYKFFLTFSSVTARFGNEGQVDYTSANDMIGKILLNERIKNPDKFYKVYAWTAWSGAGMATKETVQKVLESRGITFLPLDQGIQFFMDDLFDCVEPEVAFSGLDFTFDVDGIFESPYDTDYPFLDKEIEKDEKKVTYLRVLDLSRDKFLFDHSMKGTPLFLGSTGVETMAEIASRMNGDKKHLVELKNFSIPYGIKILKQRPKEIIIKAMKDASSENLFHCDITSVFRNPKEIVIGDPTLHYQGTYVFSDTPLDKEKIELPEFFPVYYEGEAKDIIYNPKRLFMKGLFETIKDFASFNNDLLITQIKDTSSKDFFLGVKNPRFKTDAVIIDSMFQTGGLFEFLSTNFLVLPYKIKSMKFIKSPVKGDSYLCMTRKTAIGDETITFQLNLVDPEGNLFIKVEDFQMIKLSKLEKEYRIFDRIKT